jgi:hypothetical protein
VAGFGLASQLPLGAGLPFMSVFGPTGSLR